MSFRADDSDFEALSGLRVALVHDWLFHMRGGEKCLRDFAELFPKAEIFTLLHDVDAHLDPAIASKPIHPSLLNKLPGVKNYYKLLLPLLFLGVRSLRHKIESSHNEKPFDLVISISHCAVKNVYAPKGVQHICYCLTPARYLWDQFERYLKSSLIQKLVAPGRSVLRHFDIKGAQAVTHFVGISRFIAERIKKAYGRNAEVIYPAVDMVPYGDKSKGGFFLVVNELVPYKNTDLIIHAFNELGEKLIIVGKGPEESRLRSIAKSNIEFRSNLKRDELEELYRSAEAFIFAAEEDFGMTPVEAQSAGTPVISLLSGGALETVIQHPAGEKSGIFFNELSASSIISSVKSFNQTRAEYSAQACIRSAERFNKDNFRKSVLELMKRVNIPNSSTVPIQSRSGQKIMQS